MTIFTICLILSAVMLALGVFIGSRRGLGRATVRFVYLGILGLIAVFVGKLLAGKIALQIMVALKPTVYSLVGTDVASLLDSSPNLWPLLTSLISAILTAFVVAILFGFLALLSLICFKKLSRAIVRGITKKQDAPSAKSRVFGALVGGVTAIMLALVLLSPLHTVVSLVAEVPQQTMDSLEENHVKIPDILRVKTPIAKKMSDVLSLGMSNSKTPLGKPYCAKDEIGILATASMSALDSVRAVSDNGSALQKLTAGAQSALPVIKTSPFSCELVVGAINGLGKLLLDGNSIGGLSVNTGNILTDRVMLSLAQVFTTTTVESLSDNMKTLFGVDMSIPQDQHKPTAETSNTTAETGSGNSDTPVSPDKPTETTPVDEQTGAIEYIMNVDLSNPMALFVDEKTMSDLIRAIYIISDNPNFTPVVEALGTEISTALLPSLGALETMELYQVLLYALHEEGQYDPPRSLREKVAPIKQTILTVVDKDNHHISENQAELGAICTVAHFFSPENMADPTSISYEEFKAYFGLS